jgi:hypothetical protein
MPIQSSIVSYVYFPDGAKVSVKASGEVSYTDLGAIENAVTATLNYDESQIETANAGKLAKRLKNMTIAGAFNLINLDPANIVRLGGGLFTSSTTAASANTTIPDQVIAANWNDNIKYELIAYESSSDSTKLKLSAKPTLTSVTLDAAGTPEVLAEIGAGAGGDYMVVADSNSYSGWSIIFNSAGMTTGTPKTLPITIDYGSNTPVAKTTVHCGSSGATLTASAMKITHTDSSSLVRELELYSVDANTGGFQFNFKGANEDGVESLPLSFTAKLDSSLTDGRQLFAFSIDNGAE